jgi:hypothetical protein
VTCGSDNRLVFAPARCCPWFTGRLRTQHGPTGLPPLWSRTLRRSGPPRPSAVGAGQNLLDPAVTKGVFDRLRKGKHLLQDEKLTRLSPGGTHPGPGRRRPDQRPARRRPRPGREDGQELRLQHPGRARGRPAGRGRRLPGPTHHPPRQRLTIAQAGETGSSACTALA